jgi:hypothetical protein
MLFPQPVIEGFKDAADIAGLPNQAQRYLLEMLDPQNKNTFEILFSPVSLGSNPVQIAKSIAAAAGDTLITRLHLQSLSFGFDGVEFDRAGSVKTYAKNMERANEVTITFIENDLALVRNYILYWQEQVVSFDNKTNDYVFLEDQEFAKKNCKILLQMGSGLPSPSWITIYGLRPKKIGDVTIGHAETDPWFMEVTFSVDFIKLGTVATFVKQFL